MTRAQYVSDIVTKLGPEVDARAYGGDLDDVTLQLAITDIGTSELTLLVTPGAWTIANNLTIPSNITLKVLAGGIMTVSGGVTLVINGALIAGLYQIFGLTGTITIGETKTIYPEWWGADPSTATTSQAALDKMIESIVNRGMKIVFSGRYLTTTELDFGGLSHVSFEGLVGKEGNGIYCTGAGIRSVFSLEGSDYITLRNFEIYSAGTPDVILLLSRSGAGGAGKHYIDNMTIKGAAEVAVVYCIGSEENVWTSINIGLDSGSAKYTVYISVTDDLGVGTAGGTMTTGWWIGGRIYSSNAAAVATDALIYIKGRGNALGDLTFRDLYMVGMNGSAIRLSSTDTFQIEGLLFDQIRFEDSIPVGMDHHFYFENANAGVMCYPSRITIQNCNGRPYAGSFIYTDDFVMLTDSVIMKNYAPDGYDIYRAQRLTVISINGTMVFRDRVDDSFFMTAGTSDVTFGVSGFNNVIHSGQAASDSLFRVIGCPAEIASGNGRAKEALRVTQNDIDEPGIRIIHEGANATGEIFKIDGIESATNSRNILTGVPTATTTKYIKVELMGAEYWMQAVTWA